VAAIALLGAGCSNQVVARAPVIPALTATTLIPQGPVVTAPASFENLVQQVLTANPPTASEIAHAPINQLRTKSLANIATKLNALNGAVAALNTLTHLSAAGVALEKDELSGAIEGLTALQSQITGETDIVQMRSEASHLVDYADVGTLIVPKVVLLQSANSVLSETDNLNTQIGQLQTRINNAAAKGRNTGPAVAALATVRADTSQAAGIAGGLMSSVPLLAASQTGQITAGTNSVNSARSDASAAQAATSTVGTALQAVGA
jgi:hypothetical protein